MKRVTVGELMTPEVATLAEGETLLLADDVMRLGRIRHLPVVRGDRLVGIVSQRDVLRASISSLVGLSRSEDAAAKRSVRIDEVMTRQVETARADELAAVACGRMLEKKLGCLPVVDAEGRLLGLLTETDFVRLALRFLG